jgi:hypothetical protein
LPGIHFPTGRGAPTASGDADQVQGGLKKGKQRLSLQKEMVLKQLLTSTLRNLLIEEVKLFILALDSSSTDELQVMKDRLKQIFELIRQREQDEVKPLAWGRSTPDATGSDSEKN